MPGDSVALTDPLLTKANLAEVLGLCVRSLERLIRDHSFPPPLRLTPNGRSRWRRSTVERFLREREEAVRRGAGGLTDAV